MAGVDRGDLVSIPDMFGVHDKRTAVVVCKSKYSDATYEIVAPATGDTKYKDHRLSVKLTDDDLDRGSLRKSPTYVEPWRTRPIPADRIERLGIRLSKEGMRKIAKKLAAMCVGE